MEEHRQRVSAATNAATLGELQSLVADLQTANAAVKSPSKLWAQPSLKSPAVTRLQSGGWGDATSTSAKSDDDVLVDVGKFDPTAIVGVFRGAPETLGIKPPDVTSSYINLDPASDPTAPDPLTVTVYVSSDFGSGYIEMAGDGTVKQINYPST